MYLDAKKERTAAACLSDWFEGPMGNIKATEWIDPKDEVFLSPGKITIVGSKEVRVLRSSPDRQCDILLSSFQPLYNHLGYLQDRLKERKEELRQMMEKAQRLAAVSLYLDKGRGLSQDLISIAMKDQQRVAMKENKASLGLVDKIMV